MIYVLYGSCFQMITKTDLEVTELTFVKKKQQVLGIKWPVLKLVSKIGNVVTHLVVHWHSYIFYVRESVSVHLSPSDINFVIRWWAQRPVWMSAYLPVLCDCINSSVENLHCNAPITDAPQGLDFKQTSKKHNRNYYLAVGSTAATTRFIYILLTGVLPLWKEKKEK